MTAEGDNRCVVGCARMAGEVGPGAVDLRKQSSGGARALASLHLGPQRSGRNGTGRQARGARSLLPAPSPRAQSLAARLRRVLMQKVAKELLSMMSWPAYAARVQKARAPTLPPRRVAELAPFPFQQRASPCGAAAVERAPHAPARSVLLPRPSSLLSIAATNAYPSAADPPVRTASTGACASLLRADAMHLSAGRGTAAAAWRAGQPGVAAAAARGARGAHAGGAGAGHEGGRRRRAGLLRRVVSGTGAALETPWAAVGTQRVRAAV